MLSLILVLVTALFVVIVLAITFVRFTDIRESSAKALMLRGALNVMLFSKTGYRLATKEEEKKRTKMKVPKNGKTETVIVRAHDLVLADEGYKPSFWKERAIPFLGGLRWYIAFLEELDIRQLTWTKTTVDKDGVFKLEGRSELAYDILVGQRYPYGLEVRGNDIVDADGVPVEVALTLNAMISNPRMALFEVRSWFESLISAIEPFVRNYVNTHKYKEVIKEKLDEDVFRALHEKRRAPDDPEEKENWTGMSVIEELSKGCGVKLLSIRCRRFSLTEEYQDLVSEKWEADMAADRRTGSTWGAIIKMLATATKKETEQMAQAEARVRADLISEDEPTRARYASLLETSKDFVDQTIAADASASSALRRYYFKGGSGGLDLVALLGDVFRSGSGGGSGGGDSGKNKNEANRQEQTEEEDEEDWGPPP